MPSLAVKWLKEFAPSALLVGKKLQQKGRNRNALNYSSNFLSLCIKHQKKVQTSPALHTHHKGVTEARCPLLGEIQVSFKDFEDESFISVTEPEHTNSKMENVYFMLGRKKRNKNIYSPF